ncbi:ubiquinol-cytochrome c reductase complex assembly factor 2 [Cricetulus griseus]
MFRVSSQRKGVLVGALHQGAGQAGPKMAALRYRRFLKLCEEWPVDETKRGRDLGAYLRKRVAQAFREGENTQVTGGEEVGGVGARGGGGGESAHAPAP